ncbi:MAG: DUF3467 domain-containing protein [Patescibacteria group bacterium]|nr:DUF3467 domain-containing protein [Patescibacteria group bacterium]
MEKTEKKIPTPIKVNIDPMRTPILYADVIRVSSSENGFVFDIGQGIAGTNQAVVVARVGLSKEHAKKFAEIVAQHVLKQGVMITGDKKIIN